MWQKTHVLCMLSLEKNKKKESFRKCTLTICLNSFCFWLTTTSKKMHENGLMTNWWHDWWLPQEPPQMQNLAKCCQLIVEDAVGWRRMMWLKWDKQALSLLSVRLSVVPLAHGALWHANCCGAVCCQHTSASKCASRASIGSVSDLLCCPWMHSEFLLWCVTDEVRVCRSQRIEWMNASLGRLKSGSTRVAAIFCTHCEVCCFCDSNPQPSGIAFCCCCCAEERCVISPCWMKKNDVAKMRQAASTTRPTATDACAWTKALRCGSLEGKAP